MSEAVTQGVEVRVQVQMRCSELAPSARVLPGYVIDGAIERASASRSGVHAINSPLETHFP